MNVIVCCEESQAVCIEFRKLGHNAYSCDLQKCSGGHPEFHFNEDCFKILNNGNGGIFVTEAGNLVEINGWDLLIGHPPCTYISNVGNDWFNISKYWLSAINRWCNRFEAVDFFFEIYRIGKKIGKFCLENPVGYLNGGLLPPSQTIHPYYFGDSDMKKTCLWVGGLPLLYHQKTEGLFFEKTWIEKPEPVYIAKDGQKIYFTDSIYGLGEDAQKLRSKTFQGIAKAMATQWG